ncbi:MAG: hypothetical protein HY363_02095 [Candidatus Aenigmarchaeota archaeon]|nr:hypothetical protein [Candidatus Aenigmarchaeota archaeon]
MDELVTTCAAYPLYVLTGYVGILTAADAVAIFAGKKITSQEQLESVVEEEAAKLKLDGKRLLAVYNPRVTAQAHIEGYDTARDVFVPAEQINHKTIVEFKILELGKFRSTRATVRHELYHLARHFGKIRKGLSGKLVYFFYQEPTAILYSLTRIKL